MKSKKHRDETLSMELITRLKVDLLRGTHELEIESQPGEEESAKQVLQAFMASRQAPTDRTAAADGPRLFEEMDKYLEERARGGSWGEQTILDIRGDFNQFKTILGDIGVGELSHASLNALRDTLMRLPANINKLPQTRGRSIGEVLALGLPRQSVRNVQKKWDRLNGFCDWLVGRGLIAQNFATGKKPKGKSTSHDKFTDGDLKALFESDFYRDVKYTEAFEYWLPHLALFSGARLEELAQLHLGDVRQDERTAIWYLNITAEAEEGTAEPSKQLKNSASERQCPLHSDIIAAGFISYVEALRARGYGRLFPELNVDSIGKVGSRASEWFTDYRRSVNVGANVGRSMKAFHSFRHTVNAHLQAKGVAQEVREALLGHTSRSVNVAVYGASLPLQMLKDTVEKLQYGVEISPFQDGSVFEKARQRARRMQAHRQAKSTREEGH